ncbi:MAG: replication-relaxation family protein [Jatrophihabitantaceae bacterium]
MSGRPARGTAQASMAGVGPVPQRALRAHRPSRPSDRAALSPEHLAQLSHRLTRRDRWLAHLLLEHRVLTTTQITQLGFGVPRTANLRLAKLYQWRVVDRFQPFAERGSAPMHYVLDLAGAHILAATWGVTAADLGYRHDRALQITHSLHLAHTVAATGIYTALVATARHCRPLTVDSGGDSSQRVTAWWSESRCARYFGTHVRPDGYGRWREAGSFGSDEVEFFLEYDFGTEALARVARKLTDYYGLAEATGLITPVLFWFPTAEREAHARTELTTALHALPAAEGHVGAAWVPVATTSSSLPGALGGEPVSPAGTRWLPVHPFTIGRSPQPSADRVRLAQLTRAWPTRARPTIRPVNQPVSTPPVGTAHPGRGRHDRAGRSPALTWPAPAAMPPHPHILTADGGTEGAA